MDEPRTISFDEQDFTLAYLLVVGVLSFALISGYAFYRITVKPCATVKPGGKKPVKPW